MKYTADRFYDRIAFMYPLINYFLKAQRTALIEAVNSTYPGTLLEIGVGDGVHLPLYANHKITGIDISEGMLQKAQRFKTANVELLLMDGEDLSFPDGSFNYVVMSHVLAVSKNPEVLLDEVYRVMKPGGKLFVLNHFTPDNGLKYIDWAFHPLSSLFHFKSLFHISSIKGLQNFSLVKQMNMGRFSYYKLLIYVKP